MSDEKIVILGLARTPMGGFQGDLASLTTPELGGEAIRAAVEAAGIDKNEVGEIIMGCVLPAGLGQAPARQAALNAQMPLNAGCTTINKVCGSGMKATMLAHDLLLAGTNKVMVAGGMESMTNSPYMLSKARGGYRLGHGEILDHMFFDGLQDHYSKEHSGKLMGMFAEACAKDYGFSREEQDNFAIESTKRAQTAIETGAFEWEISPIKLQTRKGEVLIKDDEQPPKARIDKIPSLKPAFVKDGTVTAANSSSISDGAAALVLAKESVAKELGAKPIARILGHTTNAIEPHLFPVAPVGSIEKLLQKLNWKVEDVDLWEINEAFAVVTMIAMQDLKLDHNKVNVNGGACALGHPIGASGARILISLIGALKARGKKTGIASLCIGGGEATAIAVELID